MIELSHYKARRQALFERMVDDSIVFLSAAPACYRNSDTEYPYRQNSDFYYLTGMKEDNALLVMIKQRDQLRYILFCQERDETIERWTGRRAGTDGAKVLYGADEAYSMTELSARVSDMLIGLKTIYCLLYKQETLNKKIISWIQALPHRVREEQRPCHWVDLRGLVAPLRLIKGIEEKEALQTACDISVNAHIAAMQQCEVGLYEYELEAVLLSLFYKAGSRYPAYPSIVAGGDNACTLHYTNNNAVLNNNDLVLIDAGAEYDYYAADITRTFPINGKFTRDQQAIYELVLASQEAALAYVRPGVAWGGIQTVIIDTLVAGLVDLKILKGSLEGLIEQKAHLPFYMHNSGHWLGLDVHDVGDYRIGDMWQTLSAGMVFTVEPGLYFSKENVAIPEQYRGIGIRIEDDVYMTEEGKIVLTAGVPKTVIEIEKIMQQ